MRSKLSIALICIVLNSVNVISEGAPLITATNRLPTPGSGTFAVPFGKSSAADDPAAIRVVQTFTTEVGGWLHSASVTAASLNADPTGLQLAVTAWENGQPGTVLATAPLQGLYVNGLFSDLKVLNAVADFAGERVVLDEQQQYALLFVTDRHPINYHALGAQTIGTSHQYTGGELLRSQNGGPFLTLPTGDLLFEVTVEPVPEPTALALALFGAAAGSRRARSRHFQC
jgi:hypothetical protein